MKFNELAKVINESITSTTVASEETEGTRGRAPNPEIEKLVAQGMPYWKARALVKKGMGSSTPAPSSAALDMPTAKPSMFSSASLAKSQAAVDDYISANPDSSLEDVVGHLKGLNAGPLAIKSPYVVSPKEVAKMVSVAKGEDTGEETPELSAIDDEKKAKWDRVRKFMSLPKAARDKILAKGKETGKGKEQEKDDEEGEVEIDPYVSTYVSGMKKREDDEEPEVTPTED